MTASSPALLAVVAAAPVSVLEPDGIVDVPLAPPSEWFAGPDDDWDPNGPLIQVFDNGRVTALVAPYGECILNGRAGCFTPPVSATNYEYAHVGAVRCDDGNIVRVANIGGDINHFDPRRVTEASLAASHYANTATRRMIGRYIDLPPVGIVFCGSLYPGTTHEQVFEVMTSALSGDWRWIESLNDWEMCGSQLVNNPGFRPNPLKITSFNVADLVQLRSNSAAGFYDIGAKVASVDCATDRVVSSWTPVRPDLGSRAEALIAGLGVAILNTVTDEHLPRSAHTAAAGKRRRAADRDLPRDGDLDGRIFDGKWNEMAAPILVDIPDMSPQHEAVHDAVKKSGKDRVAVRIAKGGKKGHWVDAEYGNTEYAIVTFLDADGNKVRGKVSWGDFDGVADAGYRSPEQSNRLRTDTPGEVNTVLHLPDPFDPNPESVGLTKVGGQGGSNPGGRFRVENPELLGGLHKGDEIYIKRGRTPDHIRQETAANLLYELAGVAVPDVFLNDDDTVIGSKILDGNLETLREGMRDPDIAAKVREGFAVDAWLANWDVAGLGYDNILIEDGKPVRVDAGGALGYRAMGGPKGDAFGPHVGELETLRNDPYKPSGDVFGPITDTELVASADRVAQIRPEQIRKVISDLNIDDSVADTLIARRADIIARVLDGVDPYSDDRIPVLAVAPPSHPVEPVESVVPAAAIAEAARGSERVAARLSQDIPNVGKKGDWVDVSYRSDRFAIVHGFTKNGKPAMYGVKWEVFTDLADAGYRGEPATEPVPAVPDVPDVPPTPDVPEVPEKKRSPNRPKQIDFSQVTDSTGLDWTVDQATVHRERHGNRNRWIDTESGTTQSAETADGTRLWSIMDVETGRRGVPTEHSLTGARDSADVKVTGQPRYASAQWAVTRPNGTEITGEIDDFLNGTETPEQFAARVRETVHAAADTDTPTEPTPALQLRAGDRVEGLYMGDPFVGTIRDKRDHTVDSDRTLYTVDLDAPTEYNGRERTALTVEVNLSTYTEDPSRLRSIERPPFEHLGSEIRAERNPEAGSSRDKVLPGDTDAALRPQNVSPDDWTDPTPELWSTGIGHKAVGQGGVTRHTRTSTVDYIGPDRNRYRIWFRSVVGDDGATETKWWTALVVNREKTGGRLAEGGFGDTPLQQGETEHAFHERMLSRAAQAAAGHLETEFVSQWDAAPGDWTDTVTGERTTIPEPYRQRFISERLLTRPITTPDGKTGRIEAKTIWAESARLDRDQTEIADTRLLEQASTSLTFFDSDGNKFASVDGAGVEPRGLTEKEYVDAVKARVDKNLVDISRLIRRSASETRGFHTPNIFDAHGVPDVVRRTRGKLSMHETPWEPTDPPIPLTDVIDTVAWQLRDRPDVQSVIDNAVPGVRVTSGPSRRRGMLTLTVGLGVMHPIEGWISAGAASSDVRTRTFMTEGDIPGKKWREGIAKKWAKGTPYETFTGRNVKGDVTLDTPTVIDPAPEVELSVSAVDTPEPLTVDKWVSGPSTETNGTTITPMVTDFVSPTGERERVMLGLSEEPNGSVRAAYGMFSFPDGSDKWSEFEPNDAPLRTPQTRLFSKRINETEEQFRQRVFTELGEDIAKVWEVSRQTGSDAPWRFERPNINMSASVAFDTTDVDARRDQGWQHFNASLTDSTVTVDAQGPMGPPSRFKETERHRRRLSGTAPLNPDEGGTLRWSVERPGPMESYREYASGEIARTPGETAEDFVVRASTEAAAATDKAFEPDAPKTFDVDEIRAATTPPWRRPTLRPNRFALVVRNTADLPATRDGQPQQVQLAGRVSTEPEVWEGHLNWSVGIVGGDNVRRNYAEGPVVRRPNETVNDFVARAQSEGLAGALEAARIRDESDTTGTDPLAGTVWVSRSMPGGGGRIESMIDVVDSDGNRYRVVAATKSTEGSEPVGGFYLFRSDNLISGDWDDMIQSPDNPILNWTAEFPYADDLGSDPFHQQFLGMVRDRVATEIANSGDNRTARFVKSETTSGTDRVVNRPDPSFDPMVDLWVAVPSADASRAASVVNVSGHGDWMRLTAETKLGEDGIGSTTYRLMMPGDDVDWTSFDMEGLSVTTETLPGALAPGEDINAFHRRMLGEVTAELWRSSAGLFTFERPDIAADTGKPKVFDPTLVARPDGWILNVEDINGNGSMFVVNGSKRVEVNGEQFDVAIGTLVSERDGNVADRAVAWAVTSTDGTGVAAGMVRNTPGETAEQVVGRAMNEAEQSALTLPRTTPDTPAPTPAPQVSGVEVGVPGDRIEGRARAAGRVAVRLGSNRFTKTGSKGDWVDVDYKNESHAVVTITRDNGKTAKTAVKWSSFDGVADVGYRGDTPPPPDVPTAPDTPDVPDTPHAPDVPDTPPAPDTPDTPEVVSVRPDEGWIAGTAVAAAMEATTPADRVLIGTELWADAYPPSAPRSVRNTSSSLRSQIATEADYLGLPVPNGETPGPLVDLLAGVANAALATFLSEGYADRSRTRNPWFATMTGDYTQSRGSALPLTPGVLRQFNFATGTQKTAKHQASAQAAFDQAMTNPDFAAQVEAYGAPIFALGHTRGAGQATAFMIPNSAVIGWNANKVRNSEASHRYYAGFISEIVGFDITAAPVSTAHLRRLVAESGTDLERRVPAFAARGKSKYVISIGNVLDSVAYNAAWTEEGVLAHEYGHVVDGVLSATRARPRERQALRPYMPGGELHHVAKEVSDYTSHRNDYSDPGQEFFAELYALIHSPNFDQRVGFSPEAEEMFVLFREAIKPPDTLVSATPPTGAGDVATPDGVDVLATRTLPDIRSPRDWAARLADIGRDLSAEPRPTLINAIADEVETALTGPELFGSGRDLWPLKLIDLVSHRVKRGDPHPEVGAPELDDIVEGIYLGAARVRQRNGVQDHRFFDGYGILDSFAEARAGNYDSYGYDFDTQQGFGTLYGRVAGSHSDRLTGTIDNELASNPVFAAQVGAWGGPAFTLGHTTNSAVAFSSPGSALIGWNADRADYYNDRYLHYAAQVSTLAGFDVTEAPTSKRYIADSITARGHDPKTIPVDLFRPARPSDGWPTGRQSEDDDSLGMMTAINAVAHSVGWTPGDTLRHEYGHLVDGWVTTGRIRAAERAKFIAFMMSDEGREAAEEISGYATFSIPEAFAEAYSVVTHPRFSRRRGYSPNAEKVFRIVQMMIAPLDSPPADPGALGEI